MDNHNLSPRGEYGRERLQGGLGFDGLDKHAGVVAKRLRMSIIMRKYLTIGLTLTLILGSDVRTFARQSGLLNQQQVISHLVAQSLLGEYPNGRQWSERFHHDGSTTYREGSRVIHGNTYFRDDFVCFHYSNDPKMSGGCFEVWKRGANCFDFYGSRSPNSSQTYATKIQKQFGQNWSAQAWYSNQPNTCLTGQYS